MTSVCINPQHLWLSAQDQANKNSSIGSGGFKRSPHNQRNYWQWIATEERNSTLLCGCGTNRLSVVYWIAPCPFAHGLRGLLLIISSDLCSPNYSSKYFLRFDEIIKFKRSFSRVFNVFQSFSIS